MTYTTSDMGVAAALLSYQYELIDVDAAGTKFKFNFTGDDLIERRVREYFEHQLVVDAYSMTMNIKKVKTLIYQEKMKKSIGGEIYK